MKLNSALYKNDVFDLIYPVGSIYLSLSYNPDTVNKSGKYGCPLADIRGTWYPIEYRGIYCTPEYNELGGTFQIVGGSSSGSTTFIKAAGWKRTS